MPIFKIEISVGYPRKIVEMFKEKDTAKAAYNFAVQEAIDIFGVDADSIHIEEQPVA